MTRTVRRLAALTLVVLLVSSSVAAPVAGASLGAVTGTAAIDSPDGEPYTSGSGVCSYDGLFNLLGINLNTDCGDTTAPETTSTNVTKTSIHQDVAETKSWAETSTTQTNNSLLNVQTTLYAYGEAEQNAIITNGTTSVSTVNTQVNKTIDDRIAKMQYNQLQAWNQYAQSLRNTVVAKNTTNVTPSYISVNYTHDTGGAQSFALQPEQFAWTNLTLANGSIERVQVIGTSNQDIPNETDPRSGVWSAVHHPVGVWSSSGANTASYSDFYIEVDEAPDGSPTLKVASKPSEWAQNWQTLQQKAQLAKQNLAATAQWKVDAYQAGELDLANATSPLTLAQEYATSYNSTGNLAYARATAAAAGYATPSLENVSVMTIRDEQAGYNYTGALFSQYAPPNGTWTLGQTYNAQTIDGVQLVATTTGKTHTLEGNFTVTSMKNANGETLNQTHVRQYDYTVANTSQYQQLQQELNELRETIANRTASGGGGSSSGGGSGSLAIVGLLAVLAVAGVAYLQRDN